MSRTPDVVDPRYSSQSRTERLIAVLRVVLAAGSLFAIWLDPTQPAKYEATTYTLLNVYLAYAALLAVMVLASRVALPSLGLVTHAVDLVAFTVFIFLTEGPPVSPFFVYFTFALVCATLRWQWQGAVWTAAVSLVAFIGMGLTTDVVHDELLNRFIIRGVYLGIAAVLFVYMGVYEQRLRREVARLAAQAPRASGDAGTVARTALEHVASVLDAPRVVMVWEESEEPWRRLAAWSGGRFETERSSSVDGRALVAAAVEGKAFLCPDAAAPDATVVYTVAGGFRRWYGGPLDAAFRERFTIRRLLSFPLAGEGWEGRLFVLDKKTMTSDDLVVGGIVADHVIARLDHFYLVRRLQQAAALRERVRLARDLHDGLLQSLAGTALQLESVRRTVVDEPAAAAARLDDIIAAIAGEQRALRTFIRDLKPIPPLAMPAPSALRGKLETLVARFSSQWNVAVEIRADRLPDGIPAAIEGEVLHIVHEALVNAARHGRASAVQVDVAVDASSIALRIADNGRGFPFTGRHDFTALMAANRGPRSLEERIASLGGALSVDSSAAGACLEIRVPLVPAAV